MKRSGLVALSTLSLLSLVGSTFAADWPEWRGPKRDNLSTETGLLKEWPEDGPPIAWQVENAGIGFASVVVKDGKVYTQGDLDGVEHILCYRESDGQLLWSVQPEPVKLALTKQVEEFLAKADTNKDGKLDEFEALSARGESAWTTDTATPGADPAELAKKRTAAIITKFDKNGDGKLADTELPDGILTQLDRIDSAGEGDPAEIAAARVKAYLALDTDKDGKLSKTEVKGTYLARIFNNVDQKVTGTNKGDDLLTEEELSTFLASKEKGRDGLITAAELAKYLEGRFPGRDGELTAAELRGAFGGYRNGNGDGPRGTPTVDGDRVFVEGAFGDVTCLEAATGKTVWHLNLSKDLGGGRPGWGYCESPLIVDDRVIVTPGGSKGTVAAVDKKTGDIVWRSAEEKQGAHYSSPVVASIGGIKQIVQFSSKSVFGVALETGRPLWSYSGAANGTANISTPIVAGDYVLSASGYGTGAGLVKISTENSTDQKASQVYFQPKLANHHGGVIKVGDYVYGFGGAWVCMNFLTGEIVWQGRGVGKGAVTYADGMLYMLGEGYELGLAEATPEAFREHGRVKLKRFDKPAWAHPVIANGRLYIRTQNRLTAYDVKAR